MENLPHNESQIDNPVPRVRFYQRTAFRTISVISIVLLILFLIGLLFDSSYFRF